MLFSQNKTKQKIISLLIIVSIFFSVPVQAKAQGDTENLNVAETSAGVICKVWMKIKGAIPSKTNVKVGDNSEFLRCQKPVAQWLKDLFQAILKQIAQRALNKMTESTVRWINSGFHGQPLFLENPESFFKDIVKFEVKKFVDMFGYDLRRFPYGKDFALNTIAAYKSTVQNNAAHTLSGTMTQQEIAEYMDFDNGGWDSLFIQTQYPQNNYIGFQLLATDALAEQLEGTIEAPAKKINNLLVQGQGFLSPQKCESNPAYNNGRNEWQQPSFDRSSVPYNCPAGCPLVGPPSPGTDPTACDACRATYNAALIAAEKEWAKTNTCPGGLTNTTPGTVLADQIKSKLDVKFQQTQYAAMMGNSLSVIFDALLNKFLADGLSGLERSINNQPADNWSYNGNTLDDTEPGDLIIPQNVSVNVGQTSSTIISGGTAPYGIKTLQNASIATASVSGNSLSVAGVAAGKTSAIVKDSSIPEKTKMVQITVVGAGGLTIIPANALVKIGEVSFATVSSGTPPYRILENSNQSVALASLGDSILIITGKLSGEAAIKIIDSSLRPKTSTVDVTVVDENQNTGMCERDGDVIEDLSEEDCLAIGGTWTPNTQNNLSVTLSATPTDIAVGENSILSWTSINTTSCLPSWTFSSTGTSGSSTVSPIRTRTYSITCSDAEGNSTADSVTVNVN